MKRTILVIGMILIFLTGLSLVLYPVISEYFTQKNQTLAISQYQKAVEGLPEQEIQTQLEMATNYNNSIRGNPVKDPFLEGSGIAIPDNYDGILNYDGVIGYVEVPKIKINIPVYHGVAEETLKYYVGHIPETAFPIGGTGNHTVLCGHRGLTTAKLFTDLNKLETGDVFYIHILNQTLAYQVTSINVVIPQDTSLLKYEPDEDLVTLLTCTPYGINSHRLLVRGSRVPYEQAKAAEVAGDEAFSFIDWFVANRVIIIIVSMCVIIAVTLVFILRRKTTRR